MGVGRGKEGEQEESAEEGCCHRGGVGGSCWRGRRRRERGIASRWVERSMLRRPLPDS